MPLRSGFTWLLSGNVLYSACQMGIVWVLARAGALEQVGQYALGMAVSAPFLMFADFQLRALIASDLKRTLSLGDYLSFRGVALGLALLGISATAWATQNRETAAVIIAVGIAQALELVSDTFYGVMQREERLDRMSRSLIVKGPLALGAMAVTLLVTQNLLLAIVALAIARAAVLVLWDARLSFSRTETLSLRWEWPRFKTLFGLALPLGIVAMLSSLNANVPRYFIEGHWGKAALGIYSPIASLLTAGALVVSAMGQTLFVPVAQAFDAGDSAKFRAYVLQAVALGGTLGLLATLSAIGFGRQILGLIFGAKYQEHASLFVVLTCTGAIAFIVSGLGYVITAARSLRPQVPLMLSCLLVTSLASYFLVPIYGLEGAAWSIGLGAAVQLAGTIWILAGLDRGLKQRVTCALSVAHGAEGAVQ